MFGDILSKAIVPPKPQSNLPHPVPRKRGLRRVRLFLAMKTTPIDQPNPEIIQFMTSNKDHSRRVLVTVDAADAWILNMRWSSVWARNGRLSYIQRTCTTGGDPVKSLHRILTRPSDGMFVDHADRDPTNNTRKNLRVCTPLQNARNKGNQKNRSGFRGVNWHAASRKWKSQILVNYKRHYLGLFKTPEEAHAAYCAAALKFHGEFAFNP